MKIIDDYYDRLKQATSREEKQAIATELHELAKKFDIAERAEYEDAMREKHRQTLSLLPEIDAVVKRSQDLLAAIEARRSVQV